MSPLPIADLQRALGLSEAQALMLADVVGKIRRRAPLRRSDADILLTQLERACERILEVHGANSSPEPSMAASEAAIIPREISALPPLKVRELRLRDELRTLADAARSPYVYDRRLLLGLWCRRFAISPGTAAKDLEDLAGRGWASVRFGSVAIAPEGLLELETMIRRWGLDGAGGSSP